jgi:lysozyme
VTYRAIPALLIPYLKKVEGERFKAYRDQGGVWTDGVGSTEGVAEGTVWDQAQVDQHLQADLQTAVDRLYAAVGAGPISLLSDHQYAALLSFVFNEGADPTWTIWKRVKAAPEGLALVPAELRKFIYLGKTIDAGLVNRRKADIALFSTPDEPAPAPAPTQAPLIIAQAHPPALIPSPSPAPTAPAPTVENIVMSWVSRIKNAFINLADGKPANTQIVQNPNTTLEHLLNATASVVLPVAASMPGASTAAVAASDVSAVIASPPNPQAAVTNLTQTVGTLAKSKVDSFLTQEVGQAGTEFADASLEALASAAIKAMSTSNNKTEADVASALSEFLTGYNQAAPKS